MIKKILQKLGKERNHVNSTKSLYKRPTADIIFNGKWLSIFLLKSRTRQGIFFFLFLVAPAASGSAWASGWIRAAAAGLHHSSQQPTEQGQGFNPTSSWTLCQVLNPLGHNRNSKRRNLALATSQIPEEWDAGGYDHKRATWGNFVLLKLLHYLDNWGDGCIYQHSWQSCTAPNKHTKGRASRAG